MIRNRIVTRGFNKSGKNLLVTRGFVRTFVERAQEAIVRIIRRGRSAPEYRRRDECDEFRIKVSLVRVNRYELPRPITNTIKVIICPNPNLFVRVIGNVRATIIEAVRSILIRAGISRWKP